MTEARYQMEITQEDVLMTKAEFQRRVAKLASESADYSSVIAGLNEHDKELARLMRVAADTSIAVCDYCRARLESK
jgi:hypothetical protein